MCRNQRYSFLVSVSDEFEANIIESILLSRNIISSRKPNNHSFVKITLGVSNFGIDILVLERHLEEAKSILAQHKLYLEEDTSVSNEISIYSVRRRRYITIVFGLIWFPIIIFGLIYLFLNI